ncbi:hypothetical protein ACFL14_01630 [Patescibacteria group bacterium]
MPGRKLVLVSRPGYLGKKRDAKYLEWDELYGKDSWRLVWNVRESSYCFLAMCALYEDAYYHYFENHPDVLQQLISEASGVYDDAQSNVFSGFDYTIQETNRTHIQDIAIRNAVVRFGEHFKGTELIQIRQEKGTHPLSITLSPGKVPFHRPEWIEIPKVPPSWWEPDSVEDFYQSNRWLAVRADVLQELQKRIST